MATTVAVYCSCNNKMFFRALFCIFIYDTSKYLSTEYFCVASNVEGTAIKREICNGDGQAGGETSRCVYCVSGWMSFEASAAQRPRACNKDGRGAWEFVACRRGANKYQL